MFKNKSTLALNYETSTRPMTIFRPKTASSTVKNKHIVTKSFRMTSPNTASVKAISTDLSVQDLPHRLQHRYLTEAYLQRQHDTLLSTIQMTQQDIVNHLNLNYYAIDQIKNKESLIDKDPTLAYTLYDALFQLDKQVIQQLFEQRKHEYSAATDSIGRPIKQENTPSSRFRLDYIRKTVEILNEPLAQLIRKASALDKDLGVFIEGIWKYLVVFFDVILSWNQERCQNFVEDQIANIKQKLEDSQAQAKKLEETLITKLKGHQFKMAVEQKRYLSLLEKYHGLEADMADISSKYEHLGSLENAEGEMLVMAKKLKELSETIEKVEKTHSQRKNDLNKQMLNVAGLVYQKHKEYQSEIKQMQEERRSISWQEQAEITSKPEKTLESEPNNTSVEDPPAHSQIVRKQSMFAQKRRGTLLGPERLKTKQSILLSKEDQQQVVLSALKKK